MDKMRIAISYQSAFTGLAIILGFFLGGMLFQVFGVPGIAVAGIIVLGLELASLLFFLVAPPNANAKKETTKSDNNESKPGTTNSSRRQLTKSITEKIKDSMQAGKLCPTVENAFSTSEVIVANTFTYLIAAIFSIESIACVYLFSIGPLFMYETFGVNQGSIGVIFSSASAFRSVITFMAISTK